MRIALAPINPTIGDLAGNAGRIEEAIESARAGGADLAILPELCTCGYPPRDLLFEEGFVRACEESAAAIGARATPGITAIIGTPARSRSRPGIANAAMVFRDGALIGRYEKRLLPTYDVFDEDRYFVAGDTALTVDVAGARVGVLICEDLWKGEDAGVDHRYAGGADPVTEAAQGSDVLAVLSASPFVLGKHTRHLELLATHARRHGVVVASVNQLGGNDDLVFDGGCWLIGADGRTRAASRSFAGNVVITDSSASDAREPQSLPQPLPQASPEALAFEALRLGTADYLRKTGFDRAVIGISGGIDSALTAAVAVAALGPDRVTGVLMPGRYSSEGSVTDARDLAERLGIRSVTLPINAAFDGHRSVLDTGFASFGYDPLGASLPDLAEENLQSRVRGTLMMAISNRTGAIVLTTGNKSELAVGYCTLYGDMNGGLAVLSDVPKTLVYRTARWLNEHHESAGPGTGFGRPPIPAATIEKPPSAELAPDQRDSDSLPPYDVLDGIVERRVERRQAAARIAEETSIDPGVVARICRLIDRNEYKRRQAATGLKITSVAFGTGRRYPIARG